MDLSGLFMSLLKYLEFSWEAAWGQNTYSILLEMYHSWKEWKDILCVLLAAAAHKMPGHTSVFNFQNQFFPLVDLIVEHRNSSGQWIERVHRILMQKWPKAIHCDSVFTIANLCWPFLVKLHELVPLYQPNSKILYARPVSPSATIFCEDKQTDFAVSISSGSTWVLIQIAQEKCTFKILNDMWYDGRTAADWAPSREAERLPISLSVKALARMLNWLL